MIHYYGYGAPRFTDSQTLGTEGSVFCQGVLDGHVLKIGLNISGRSVRRSCSSFPSLDSIPRVVGVGCGSTAEPDQWGQFRAGANSFIQWRQPGYCSPYELNLVYCTVNGLRYEARKVRKENGHIKSNEKKI
jgi:hypothetical protein